MTSEQFSAALESARRFLLSIANAELPAALQAKGGASDLVQETLIAAHQARLQFRGHTLADLRAWLRTILLNEIASFRRRYTETAARAISSELPLSTAYSESFQNGPAEEAIRREESSRLIAAVEQLPEESRSVIILRVELGLSFRLIGERLGRTEEAVRKIFTRSLALLREITHQPSSANDSHH